MNLQPAPMQNSSQRNLIGSRKRFVGWVAGFAVVFLLACNADARPVKWEYLVLNAGLQNRQLESLLNTNGAAGWELVQISPKGVAVFKRVKTK